MIIEQYGIYMTDLNPARGAEMNKVRPCVVISPGDMNQYLQTIIIAPVTNRGRTGYPTRVPLNLASVSGWIVLDQIRAVDKKRLIKHLGILCDEDTVAVKAILQAMLVAP